MPVSGGTEMNVAQLQKLIEEQKLDYRIYHIGEEGYFDEAFNLVSCADGTWETFYGEHGGRTNRKVYGSEEEAADAFYAIMKETGMRKLPGKVGSCILEADRRLWANQEDRTQKILFGMLVFLAVLFLVIAVMQAVTETVQEPWFCVCIALTAVFAVSAVVMFRGFRRK